MFIDYDILFILGPAIVLFVGTTFVMRSRYGKEEDPLKRALKLLKFNMIIVGAFCITLWFLLPITPALSTFGYPKSEKNIQTTELLLKYLQDYNKALVRTTSVLFWFIFVFVWWFITSFFEFARAITVDPINKNKDQRPTAQPDPGNA